MTTVNWIIASNRLPFSYDKEAKKIRKASGGLVSALSGIKGNQKISWYGAVTDSLEKNELYHYSVNENKDYNLFPVSVNKRSYDLYYNGFSNDVLWPLFHYEPNFVKFSSEKWNEYVKINKQFAKQILQTAKNGDLVWVHDFHLFLLPKFLKESKKKLKVGFFLHIPFPSSEIFRQLPVRKELQEHLLCADLIGFQDYGYLRHFVSSVEVILGWPCTFQNVVTPDNDCRLGVFPVSLDTQNILKTTQKPGVKKHFQKIKRSKKDKLTILGVDRLDYSKGLETKVLIYKKLLEDNPQLVGKVELLQVAVPTRQEVPEYVNLKKRLDELVGSLNSKFSSVDYTPVNYIYNHIAFEELIAIYRNSDILLVTSKRDGMNLVAKEYILSQNSRNPGKVFLSEYAGVHSLLSDVVSINPWDVENSAIKLARHISDRPDNRPGHKRMINFLSNYSSKEWSLSFMTTLQQENSEEIKNINIKKSSVVGFDRLDLSCLKTRNLIFLLDYDGTLSPIVDSPELAVLSPGLRKILHKLSKLNGCQSIVISGRDKKFLKKQLEGLDLSIASEHGAEFESTSQLNIHLNNIHSNEKWKRSAMQLMEDAITRVPNSFLERKKYALVWHYRQSPREFADYQAVRLKVDLESALQKYDVSVIHGKKVIEVRDACANKGYLLRELQNLFPKHFFVLMGDDRTDEDMFEALEEGRGVSIKIGKGSTSARYVLADQKDVEALLRHIHSLRS